MDSFLRGHVEAFVAFGGVARVLLYDNLKSAVLERVGDAIRFNPELLAFAAHHCFEPRPVAIARGNEKGRVDRSIRYIREAFFAAREFADLDDLNAQARVWCEGQASDRRWPEDGALSVREAFEAERASLLALPEREFVLGERLAVDVGKTPYVEWHLLWPLRMTVPDDVSTSLCARHLEPRIRFGASFSHSWFDTSRPMADLA